MALEDDVKTDSVDLILALTKLSDTERMLRSIELARYPYNNWMSTEPETDDEIAEAIDVAMDLIKVYHKAQKLSKKIKERKKTIPQSLQNQVNSTGLDASINHSTQQV